MKSLYLFFLFIALFSGIYCEESKVSIKLGTINGFKENVNGNEVNVFLGIPFAKPPIGELRFRKPQPITEKWTRDLDATKWPKMCMQSSSLLRSYNEVSEDCLYLNIWSSVDLKEDFSKNLTEVMVMIPTGAFTYMGSSFKHFNGSKLSSFGNVVVVTMNYRLGAFGFLFAGNSQAPGNVGFYDQALALEWIQENIVYFGGDPQKVTLFGESAGAMSTCFHLHSSISHGTFNRAIMMSGAIYRSLIVESKNVAIKKALELVKLLGCDVNNGEDQLTDSQMSCLYKADANKIVELQTSPRISKLSTSISKLWFMPVYNDEFIPKKPKDLIKDTCFTEKIDVLVGTIANEGYIMQFLFNEIGIALKEEEDFSQRLRSFVSYFFEKITPEELNEVVKFYFNNIENLKSDKAKMAYYIALGDVYFHCETVYFSEVFSKNNNLYQYYFNYALKNEKDNLFNCDLDRACHGNELPVTFGTVSDPKDIAASESWMKIILGFVKNGTLNWPKHEPSLKPYLEFVGSDSTDRVLHDFRSDACKLWEPIIDRNY